MIYHPDEFSVETSSYGTSSDANLLETLQAIGFTDIEISHFSTMVQELLVEEDMQDALEDGLFTTQDIVFINQIANEHNMDDELLMYLNTAPSIENIVNKVYTVFDIIEINNAAKAFENNPEFVFYLNSPYMLEADFYNQ